MMDLAMHGGKKPLSLADIARMQGVSLSYLEQIFSRLRRRGLVMGTRGRQGGYSLSRAPHQISIAEIIQAVGEDDGPAPARSASSGAARSARRGTRSQRFCTALNSRVYQFLDDINLAQTIAQAAKASASRASR
jgi:Rrf2 family iron-sulfur cluster assembly transcriptional regulator